MRVVAPTNGTDRSIDNALPWYSPVSVWKWKARLIDRPYETALRDDV